jgi:hypothetical protein
MVVPKGKANTKIIFFVSSLGTAQGTLSLSRKQMITNLGERLLFTPVTGIKTREVQKKNGRLIT